MSKEYLLQILKASIGLCKYTACLDFWIRPKLNYLPYAY